MPRQWLRCAFLQDGAEVLVAELDVESLQAAAAEAQAARSQEQEGRLRQQLQASGGLPPPGFLCRPGAQLRDKDSLLWNS